MSQRSPEDTIAAVSTPPGEGGIGIVRLSGSCSVDIVAGIFRSSSGRDLRDDGRAVYHGEIVQDDGARVLDEVLVQVMRAPRSYTREDVVEINCHGGAVVVHAVLEEVLARGARLAGPGEFTRRAFLNGRIDLVQAEAVIDRIQAQTRAGLLAASAAAGGGLSREIHALQEILLDAKARIEAAIDFPEDDLPELLTPELHEALDSCRNRMTSLLDTVDAGRLYREGASVCIAGKPNVGKSSLFNALLDEKRAIVTSESGTTRDLIEERLNLDGIPLRLHDMAGLHGSDHEAELLGMQVARDSIRTAALVLFVLDASRPFTQEDRVLSDELASLESPVLLLFNKTDLECPAEEKDFAPFARESIRVSALTGEGLDDLRSAVRRLLLGGAGIAPDQTMLTRTHQRDSLRRAHEALTHLLADFSASPEFLSIDLEDAIRSLGEITGETTPDDILERIFASFCIGK